MEYTALNQDFHTRGRRSEEQVALLRLLWTEPLVNFKGRWHTIPDAGLNPLPVQQPIPIWFGGGADRALRRAASLGDGWMSIIPTAERAAPALEKLNRFLVEAGRTPGQFGIEARLPYGEGDPSVWEALLRGWEAAGATYASINTMGCGFDTPAKHLQAIQAFARAVGLS